MSKEDLKIIESKINLCTSFGDFLKNILKIKKFKITDICKNTEIDRRKLFNLLNDLKQDVSLNLMQNLEILFDLKIGYLTNKWYFFKKKMNTSNVLETSEIIKLFGWEIIKKNDIFLKIITDKKPNESLDECEILKFLNEYYGTINPDEYSKKISNNLFINRNKINKSYRLPFIRFCELFIQENFKNQNSPETKRFREYLPKKIISKIFDILFVEQSSFDQKISKVSLILKERNIEIIKLPYIEKTFTRALSFVFGQKKYIVITDMYNSEILILFSLLREIMTCFSPWLTRNEYYVLFEEYYSIWKKFNRRKKLYMADDISESINRIRLINIEEPNYYEDVSEVYKDIIKKYKKIKF
ncbi:hypothetical protein [Metamycoplasma gateae]|uniref:HTH cro/C1-type domain-containing protein n=1 Tax=Metamycoplasma gateae TaxID=35769 RepID=A0ABZ2AHJ2_9BACT|nr:hypothetical protein V2E26_01220 [Metamycoplasma gateae]